MTQYTKFGCCFSCPKEFYRIPTENLKRFGLELRRENHHPLLYFEGRPLLVFACKDGLSRAVVDDKVHKYLCRRNLATGKLEPFAKLTEEDYRRFGIEGIPTAPEKP